MKRRIASIIILAAAICFASGCNKQVESKELLVKGETIVVEASSEVMNESGNKESISDKGMDTQEKETQQRKLAEADASGTEQVTDAFIEKKPGKQADVAKEENPGNTKALSDTGKKEVSSEKKNIEKTVEKTSVKEAEEKTSEKALEPIPEKTSEKTVEKPSENPSEKPSEQRSEPTPTQPLNPPGPPSQDVMNKAVEEQRKRAEEQNNRQYSVFTSASRSIFDQINAWRVENGLTELAWGSDNEGLASTRAYEQTDFIFNKQGSINHGYGTPWSGAENLSDRGSGAVFDGWKASGGHNQTMLGNYTYCVVYTGYADGMNGVTVALFW